jgi:hypothetical protein
MKLLPTLLLALTGSLLGLTQVQAQDTSISGTVGSQGLGVSFTNDSELSFIENDQIQWHLSLSGYGIDDAEDVKVNKNDYEADVKNGSLQAGLNWYPISQKSMKNFFLSAGALYFDHSLDGTTEDDQTIHIGDIALTSKQGVQLKTDIEHTSMAPYFGVGWGNRLNGVEGFSFRAEVGAFVALSSAQVDVELINHNGEVSDVELEKERQDILDEQEWVKLFAQLDIGYQF